MTRLLQLPNQLLAYHCARLALGASFFMHGAIRLPKLNAFANGVSSQFNDSFLAGFPSLSMGFVIPVVEVLAGLALIVGGKFSRFGLAAGILLMGALMFGTAAIENWGAMVNQLLHMVAFYLILINPNTSGPLKA